jgi:hypothetical protein
MNNADVPIWEKYTLTIEEASKYFRIGENKLRKLARRKYRVWRGDLKREPYSDQEKTV